MYVKVKRQKTTIFLLVEPADTVASVKQKLEDLLQQVWAGRGGRLKLRRSVAWRLPLR